MIKKTNAVNLAASEVGLGILKLLLEHNADLEVLDTLKETPLLSASRRGQVGVARILLDKGAQIEARNRYGMSSHAEHN